MNTDIPTEIDPEDEHARAETAFDRAGSYEFKGVPLAFTFEHEAATARLGLSFGPGDVADFLYLLTLPGARAAGIRTPNHKTAFFEQSALWGREMGIRIGTVSMQDAMALTNQILEDWQASRVDPVPDPTAPPSKN